MNNTKTFLFGLIFCSSIGFAQESGYINFTDSKTWVIQIDDSIFTSEKIVSLPVGKYQLKARPQISYNWPSIYVTDEIEIHSQDTTHYTLGNNLSNNEEHISRDLPETTLYKNSDYTPNIRGDSYLKEGLLISAFAANWLSFYLKRVSDSYDRKYRNASSLGNIKDYKGKSQDYNLYSQITLAVSTTVLSGYIYLILTE